MTTPKGGFYSSLNIIRLPSATANTHSSSFCAGNPLPAVVHAQLTAEQIGTGRVIVIGDIHGCSRELADLLDRYANPHHPVTLFFIVDICIHLP